MSVRTSKAFVGGGRLKERGGWERKIYDALVASLLWMLEFYSWNVIIPQDPYINSTTPAAAAAVLIVSPCIRQI